MKIKITKRNVEAASPGTRDAFMWDAGLTGFGLKITPKGKRVYVVQYRAAGRVRRYTIGVHGAPWTPDQARREATHLLGEVAAGRDPAGAKGAGRRAPTVAKLCDRYLAEHVDSHNKPSTAKEFRRLIERHVLPKLGSTKAKDVSRDEVMKLHHSMRATPRQANQTLSVLSKLFNLAEFWGVRPDHSNPCRMIRRFSENKRERFLSDAELGRLGAVLSESETNGTEHPSSITAFRLLALTGLRLGEVLGLKWENVDFEAGDLTFVDTKTGPRSSPIGAPALAVLAETPQVDGSPWVLNGIKDGEHISVSTVEAAWARIRTAAALGDCRIHDLRHTVGTFAGQTGANAFLVRDKLGHKTLAMTGRYVNRDEAPLRDLSEKVEGRIDAALRGSLSAEVVALGSKSGARR